MDGGTILMDVCKIQGLNRYFAKFGDKFDWFLKIQGRSWGITPFLTQDYWETIEPLCMYEHACFGPCF